MKKTLQKFLIAIIIIIMLFEFVLKNNVSNAAISTTTLGPDFVSGVTNLSGGIISVLYWPKRIIITGLIYLIDIAFYEMVKSDDTTLNGGLDDFKYLTPFQVFFNKYKLLDVNVLDLTNVDEKDVSYVIRYNTVTWFHIIRFISSVILLAILVYVGIMMAISTIASNKAKYKKMLIDWSISLFLIFIIPYICIFIINFNDLLVKALESMAGPSLVGLDQISVIYNKIAVLATLGVGIQSIAATIVFCAMVLMSIGFFIAYLNRVIKTAFLIIISPLISITYSIDKMKDQKAQAFETWMREFAYTILIQPFHCIMYLAFTNTAFKLLEPFVASDDFEFLGVIGDLVGILGMEAAWVKSIFLAKDYNLLATSILVIVSLLFIKKAEEVVRKIFGFTDSNKSTSFGAGMALSIMAVSQAKNIGTATRKGINSIKNNTTKFFTKALPKDIELFKNTEIGKNVLDKAANLKDTIGSSEAMTKLNSAVDTVTNSSRFQSAVEFGEKTKRNLRDNLEGAKKAAYKFVDYKPFKKLPKNFPVPKSLRDYRVLDYFRRNSAANIMGSMYAISQLVAGNNILEVYADKGAVEKGVNAFFAYGEGELAFQSADAAKQIDEEDYKEKINEYKNLGEDENRDPFEEALENLMRKEPSIRSEEDFRMKIQEMKDNNTSYSQRLQETRATSRELKKEGIKELERDGISPSSGATNDKLDEAKRLDEEAEKLEEFVKVQEIMRAKDEIENYWTHASIAERMLDKMAQPSDSDFKKAREGLREEILKLISKRKAEGEKVDFDDAKVALAIQSSIDENVERSIDSRNRIDLDNLINQLLNISKVDDPKEYATIMNKTNTLRRLYLEKKVAEGFDHLASVNSDSGEFSDKRLADATARKVRGRIISKDDSIK